MGQITNATNKLAGRAAKGTGSGFGSAKMSMMK